jgi:hypothetical protein
LPQNNLYCILKLWPKHVGAVMLQGNSMKGSRSPSYNGIENNRKWPKNLFLIGNQIMIVSFEKRSCGWCLFVFKSNFTCTFLFKKSIHMYQKIYKIKNHTLRVFVNGQNIICLKFNYFLIKLNFSVFKSFWCVKVKNKYE